MRFLKYPIVKNHSLVTPLTHIQSFFDMGTYERKCCLLLIDDVRKLIQEKDRSVTGFISELMMEILLAS